MLASEPFAFSLRAPFWFHFPSNKESIIAREHPS